MKLQRLDFPNLLKELEILGKSSPLPGNWGSVEALRRHFDSFFPFFENFESEFNPYMTSFQSVNEFIFGIASERNKTSSNVNNDNVFEVMETYDSVIAFGKLVTLLLTPQKPPGLGTHSNNSDLNKDRDISFSKLHHQQDLKDLSNAIKKIAYSNDDISLLGTDFENNLKRLKQASKYVLGVAELMNSRITNLNDASKRLISEGGYAIFQVRGPLLSNQEDQDTKGDRFSEPQKRKWSGPFQPRELRTLLLAAKKDIENSGQQVFRKSLIEKRIYEEIDPFEGLAWSEEDDDEYFDVMERRELVESVDSRKKNNTEK